MASMVLINGFDLKIKETKHISIQFLWEFSLARQSVPF